MVHGDSQPEELTPAPKQRMGQQPAASETAPKQRMGQQPAASETAPKQRMGQQPAASETAPKQRMGQQAAASETAPKQRMGQQPAASETAPRQRMGSAGTSEWPVAPVEPSLVSQATAPSAPSAAASSRGSGSRGQWTRRVVTVVIVALAALGLVLVARWLHALPAVRAFTETYPGVSAMPDTAPTGIPAWLGWQHFLNMFFIVLIGRTGLQVRLERRPPGYWTPNANSFFSPRGSTPKKVSMSQWLHQCLDVLWVINGLIFVVLLFATGHWMRIVPTNWDIVPNAASALLQYASLNWPHENGWIHYNALQVLAYFTTVFIMAPLAALSGIRFSTWWPDKNARLSKVYPVEIARAVHFPVMIYFVAFTIVHVFLVAFTGVLANLNHMYTSRDAADWWGLVVFIGSLMVMTAGWFLAKPVFIAPLASLMGKLSK
ncbi:hypothetical protein [Paenarthrobacter sp. NPDC058040]|uniref:hypothetical protein n=1 Tax=unclassified Paenarthrobacter TaxID=2634190 RepID=UPI0036DB8A93